MGWRLNILAEIKKTTATIETIQIHTFVLCVYMCLYNHREEIGPPPVAEANIKCID